MAPPLRAPSWLRHDPPATPSTKATRLDRRVGADGHAHERRSGVGWLESRKNRREVNHRFFGEKGPTQVAERGNIGTNSDRERRGGGGGGQISRRK